MQSPSQFDQLLDLFLLRTKAPSYHVDGPYYTTGSIVAAALLRVFIVGMVGFFFSKSTTADSLTWTIAFFAVWAIGVFPAWIQYQNFNDSVEEITTGTLCGSCKHLNKTNQLCTVLDEFVVDAKPPCEGEAWEPL